VLESGSGEPDDLTERPSDNPSPGRGSVGDADPVPLSERPSSILPQYHGNGQQTHTRRSGPLSSLSMGDILEPQHQSRSWPLRDPQEAYLLQHFVDKIAPFVSHRLSRSQGTALSNDVGCDIVRLHRSPTAFCCPRPVSRPSM
jgi:hypothetical protein